MWSFICSSYITSPCIYTVDKYFYLVTCRTPGPRIFATVQPVHVKNVKSKYKDIYTFTVHVETIILLSWFYAFTNIKHFQSIILSLKGPYKKQELMYLSNHVIFNSLNLSEITTILLPWKQEVEITLLYRT